MRASDRARTALQRARQASRARDQIGSEGAGSNLGWISAVPNCPRGMGQLITLRTLIRSARELSAERCELCRSLSSRGPVQRHRKKLACDGR
jgi:hypothetical protein